MGDSRNIQKGRVILLGLQGRLLQSRDAAQHELAAEGFGHEPATRKKRGEEIEIAAGVSGETPRCAGSEKFLGTEKIVKRFAIQRAFEKRGHHAGGVRGGES